MDQFDIIVSNSLGTTGVFDQHVKIYFVLVTLLGNRQAKSGMCVDGTDGFDMVLMVTVSAPPPPGISAVVLLQTLLKEIPGLGVFCLKLELLGGEVSDPAIHRPNSV